MNDIGNIVGGVYDLTLTNGMHRGVPFSDYLRLPALSCDVIGKMIDECPAAAWYDSYLNPAAREPDDTEATDIGTIGHALLLEGSMENVVVLNPADYPNANGKGFATGWTNKAIREARDAARAMGKTPILIEKAADVAAMHASATKFIASLQQDEPAIWAAFHPSGGDSEVTVLWNDGGVPCRMRPDRINAPRDLIIDPKFTGRSADPDSWSRTQIGPMGYARRAAWYQRGLQTLFPGSRAPDYIFLVVQTYKPYLCSLVGVDPVGLEIAHNEIERGLRAWRACEKRGVWPGYPTLVCYAETPAWAIAQAQERQAVDADRIAYGSQP